jgi:hypothetical protein
VGRVDLHRRPRPLLLQRRTRVGIADWRLSVCDWTGGSRLKVFGLRKVARVRRVELRVNDVGYSPTTGQVTHTESMSTAL